MLAARFLDEYTSEEGMERAMARFSRRIPLEQQGKPLIRAFFSDIELYQAEFDRFFPYLVLTLSE
jgi:hypothetical protein